MRNAYGKYGVLGVLVVLLLLGLLLVAGPALAGGPFVGNPPGSMWGGHDVNGWMWITDIGDAGVVARVVADDPRVSGYMVVQVDDRWYDDNGIGHQTGSFVMYDDAWNQTWRCNHWEDLYFFNAKDSESPVQDTALTATAEGQGDYSNLVFVSSHHQVKNSMFILKGSIFEK
jgi:hypothetical protein